MKIAILADIHANIYALDAVLADCRDEVVEHTIVAGDLVGYYYWPQPVVQQLMRNPHVSCIRGNHEDILAETLNDETAARRYRHKYGSGYAFCQKMLHEDEMQWLLGLPRSAEIVFDRTHFSVHHGSPTATDEYIYPDASSETLARCHVGRHFTILGHTHYSFIHHREGRILLNPGSVGQPRDFGGQASYALVDLSNQTVRIKRIPFDVTPIISMARAQDPELPYLHKIMTRRAL